ncbi:MAG: ParB/RepB/Spo0J family partition protein [Acidimicrobiales bacterium]
MAKLDELLKSAGSSITQAASFRPAPAAMPTMGAAARIGDPRRDGLDRSKDYWVIPIDRIDRDPGQPRDEHFDRDEDDPEKTDLDFTRLVESLRRDGLLQPITVVYSEEQGRFRVLIGERRFRAAKVLGWDKIAARIFDHASDPGDILAKQVIENVIRKDLKPIEQARAFRTLLTVNNWTLTQLGEAVGCSPGLISQTLKLLELSAPIRAKIEAGELDANSAYHVSKIADPVEQAEVAERIVSEGLTRDQAVEVVRQVKAREPKAKASGKSRGGARSKPKARPVTSRVMKAGDGYRITVERKKGIEDQALLEAFRRVVAELEVTVFAGEEETA